MPHIPIGLFLTAASCLVQTVVFLRWLHRRMRDDEIARTFVRDIATNHLPHIYYALRQIAERQGIHLEEPPLVQFLEVNGRPRRWHHNSQR